jgi:hypothetical protein
MKRKSSQIVLAGPALLWRLGRLKCLDLQGELKIPHELSDADLVRAGRSRSNSANGITCG